MIESLVALIVWCIGLGLIYWLVMKLPIPDPFRVVIQVLFIFIAIFLVLSLFGIGGYSMGSFRFR